MARKQLRTTWSLTAFTDMRKTYLPDLGVEWDYIFPVRWYRFWRWRLVFSRDYILSRAADIICVEQMAGIIKADIDAELKEKDDG